MRKSKKGLDIQNPLEIWFFEKYKPSEKNLVLISYDGVLRETYDSLSTYQLLVKDSKKRKALKKNDLLMAVRASEFKVVQPCCLWRKAVRDLKLSPEVGLAKKLDIKQYVNPYIFREKLVRKVKPVKVVLRNGLVVSCKLIAQDPWRLIARCKVSNAKDNIAFVLIFKHAVYSVEENTEVAGVWLSDRG